MLPSYFSLPPSRLRHRIVHRVGNFTVLPGLDFFMSLITYSSFILSLKTVSPKRRDDVVVLRIILFSSRSSVFQFLLEIQLTKFVFIIVIAIINLHS